MSNKGQQTMSDLQNAVIKLMSSPHYKALATYEPPFNPFEIVGATHRELIHSSVLAWLLRDEANKEFRQKFIDKIATDKPKLGLSAPNDHGDPRLKPTEVKTEYSFEAGVDKDGKFEGGSIDVFAHFEFLNLVVGIEVKVNAGEQPAQVERYQRSLRQDYSGYEKVIVFLTPEGYPSETKSNVSGVPVLEMSWINIAGMIRKMQSALGDENDFRMQFLQHLDRNIVMNETEEQRMVRELLSEGDNAEILNKIITNETEEQRVVRELLSEGDNAETLKKIIDNMTSLRTSLECEFWIELRKKLQAQLSLRDEALEFQLYKSGGLAPEVIEGERLGEYINKWRDRGSPGLTFRISDSSLDDDHEVVCRITYDPSLNSYYLYYGFVLCKKNKKNNIRERVEIKKEENNNHKKYLDLYSGLLEKGPEKKTGWLIWKERADGNICFADNGPRIFNTLNTLVNIKNKERKEEEDVVKNLVDEICKIIKIIPKGKPTA